ncbi:hypothetical protein BGZ65_003372 [Modicella reniformis]|uniref:Uncharacterized protein n=1 Tax=Modicella reniformis TaxID=1440133 RepID=A0A9P6SPI9_9FUNG|nr:hypothetical protein BGZ65_003372 [Modicella reniformis]
MNDQGSVSATTVLRQPLKWIVPSADVAVEAAYVAVLHPPVIVAEDVAKQLAALSNQAGLNTTMGFHKDSGYLSLQESLLLRQQVAFNTLFQSCFQETTTTTTTGSTAATTAVATAAVVVAGDETKKRQASILSGTNDDKGLEISIVIQTPQPPNMILTSFLNPYTETNMTLEILIEAGTGVPTVRLVNSVVPTEPGNFGVNMMMMNHGGNINNGSNSSISSIGSGNSSGSTSTSSSSGGSGSGDSGGGGDQPHGRPFAVENETLTKVLQTCDSVPILVRWVLKRSLAWMKERNRYQSKPQTHLGRRVSSYVEEGGILKRPRV